MVRVFVAACLIAVGLASRLQAAEPAPPGRDAAWLTKLTLAADGLAWSDELVRHDWRLQRSPGTDDWRILDPHETCVH